jgi:sulfofructosephosphate aldolase
MSPTLSDLRRPSGGFAMLAVDQREALREMMASASGASTVSDEEVRNFKLDAARALTPHASAVLIDRQFALDAAIEQKVVAPGCATIAAADHFIPAHGELVGDVEIDMAVDPAAYAAKGVAALKLLVIYRPDGAAEARRSLVTAFVERCRAAGVVSIIEPVSRKPLSGGDFDHDLGIYEAAEELGSLGADLYKAEVPTRGAGGEAEVRAGCARLTEAISSPWVVLSSGVAEDVFPSAVAWACREGASGFLAGRAVWASCLGESDVKASLESAAVDRLKRLGDVVDEEVAR